MTKQKIPKRIAGIKVPKQLRKGAVGAFLGSPGGQVLMGEALIVLAGVSARLAVPSGKAGRRLRDAFSKSAERMLIASGGKGARRKARERARALGVAVDEAVTAFRASLASSASGEATTAPPDAGPDAERKELRPAPLTPLLEH
jgi:hypothetical protein